MYINYSTFSRLYNEAVDASGSDHYIADRGWQEWMGNNEGNVNEVVSILQSIYNAAHSDFKWLREQLSISQVEMIFRYDIPRRTLQNWESGERIPPDHVKKLLSYAVIMESLNGKVTDV